MMKINQLHYITTPMDGDTMLIYSKADNYSRAIFFSDLKAGVIAGIPGLSDGLKVASDVVSDDLVKYDRATNTLIKTGVKVTPDGSVRANTNSFELGGAHSITSGGTNVFTRNNATWKTYVPAWQEIKRTDSPMPVYRKYTDSAPTELVVGSVDTDIINSPSYSLVASDNRRLFAFTIKPANTITEVVVSIMSSGVVVWRMNIGQLVAGETKVIEFDVLGSALDVRVGLPLATMFTSVNGIVWLYGNQATGVPYLSVLQRVWAEDFLTGLDGINGALALKADKTYVDSQDAALTTQINLKANSSDVTAALALKADKTYVDSQDSAIVASVALKADKTYVDSQDLLKVDKVAGKGLSTNDYTTAEQTKLAGITAGADMLRSVYDTNLNGIVDNSEKVNGVNTAGNLKYYGTNSGGTVGFFDVPVLPAARSVTNVAAGGRPFGSIFTISATRDSLVTYTITAALSAAIASSSNAQVDLQVDGVVVASSSMSLTLTLAVTLGVALPFRDQLVAYVPAGKTVQLVRTGSVSATLVAGQEVLL
ncbi:MAG: hypothetical protein [Bacteriophage sp.]|nr:MAG: hypothetical protein [Bacteriophage sp.]